MAIVLPLSLLAASCADDEEPTEVGTQAEEGELDGTTVTAELTPGAACTYTFEGTLIETKLTGEFEPTRCLGGESGAWALDLR